MRFIIANSVGSKSSRRLYPNSIFEAVAQVNAFFVSFWRRENIQPNLKASSVSCRQKGTWMKTSANILVYFKTVFMSLAKIIPYL